MTRLRTLLAVLPALVLGPAAAHAACPSALVYIGGEPDPDTLSVSAGSGGSNQAHYAFNWHNAMADVFASAAASVEMQLHDEFTVSGGQAGAARIVKVEVTGWAESARCCFPGAPTSITVIANGESFEVFPPTGLQPVTGSMTISANVGIAFPVTVLIQARGPVAGVTSAAGSGGEDSRMTVQLRLTDVSAGQAVLSCHGYDSRQTSGVAPALAPALRLAFATPAGPAASAAFTLPEAADVRFDVLDLLGRRVRTLAAGTLAAGAHALALDPAGTLRPGVYAVRLRAGDAVTSARLIVAR